MAFTLITTPWTGEDDARLMLEWCAANIAKPILLVICDKRTNSMMMVSNEGTSHGARVDSLVAQLLDTQGNFISIFFNNADDAFIFALRYKCVDSALDENTKSFVFLKYSTII